jgi:hypothetical protein
MEAQPDSKCNTCGHQHDLKIEADREGVCPFQKICDKEPFRMYKPAQPDSPTVKDSLTVDSKVIAELRGIIMKYENREASCCPEGVGFEIVIANLKAKLADSQAQVAGLVAALDFIALQPCTHDSGYGGDDEDCTETGCCVTEMCLSCYARVHTLPAKEVE